MRIAAGTPAPFISAIVPSVRMKITARMSAGAAVHAISRRLLRSKVAASPPRCRDARYRQIAKTSAPSTPMKMRSAMTPTMIDRVPIASAGGRTVAG